MSVGPLVRWSVTLSFFCLLGPTNAVYTAPLLVLTGSLTLIYRFATKLKLFGKGPNELNRKTDFGEKAKKVKTKQDETKSPNETQLLIQFRSNFRPEL